MHIIKRTASTKFCGHAYNCVVPAQILATKLYIPAPRSKIVLRPRLIERMNEGLAMGRRLTLISASAGFGKTTLISEWIAALTSNPSPAGREEGVRVAWLSLDEGDKDPVRFIAYLIAALQTIKAGLGEGILQTLQSRQQPQVEIALTALLNEISSIPDPFLLILDDYHVVDSKSVDEALAFLVERLPPQMHLVITAREDPSLPLARLRARGQLTELRAADLQFTAAEATEFLNRVMGLNLSNGDIAALESRTEGWIAGLQLAALSMQGHQDAASFVKSFTGSHRFVLDYLIEEVLGQQSEEIQTFLLRTSILDRMCGPLCDAVLLDPSTSGQEILEQLERANLFIVPLDNERRWYRYHHLFGDLLRQRLGQPRELPEYHLRASVWYEANADLAQAFHHALAAGDFERSANLAEAAWQGMERNFQTAAWIGWVKKLPNAVVCSRPRLCVSLGRAYSDAGEVESSETYLQNAERALADALERDESKSLLAIIALIRSNNAQIQGNLAETIKYAELSIPLMPEDDVFHRAEAAITLGFTHWVTGNLESSLRAIHAWIEDMQRLGKQEFAIASAFAVADMQVILGRLNDAEKSLRHAIQQAAAHGRESETITAHHHLELAMLAHERGDNAASAQSLEIAADLGQRTTLVDWTHRWNLAQARLKESDGEFDSALQSLDDAQRGYVKNPIPIFHPIAAHKARIHLRQGRLDKAQAWARERSLSVKDEASYLGEYEHLTLARVCLAEGSFAGVHEMLERLLALAESQKRMGSVIEILLTQALVHQAQGNHPQALSALERALILAEPEGYIRIFVNEGEAMRSLLSDLRAKSPAHPLLRYVDRILNFFPQSAEIIFQSKIQNRKSEIVEPLTNREIEILRLIAAGHSNTEIGQRLYLALSTVKGHNLRIFNKLQVENRTEAVARARELGLL
ncbi:MAG: helix-turn-helix transcriptional regulator [Chloroflexi bacterium]|nr:helix-turn-helix transcriptional regulator [Chloroflexota bacterium]MDL1941710.1 helix-turn-helix transcriptional regulator [Chloroflexi bacterium CFX2]